MYCPRCGMAAMETTKYCKSCGLPLMPVYNYVSGGGTGALVPPSPEAGPPPGMTPKQRMILTILFCAFSPAIFGTLGAALGMDNLGAALAGISAVLMPLGIVWAVFYFKAQMRRLESQSARALMPQVPLAYVPPPLQTHAQPLPPHRTNPLDAPPRPLGSFVDDETRRLPDQPAAPPPSSGW